MRASYRNSIVVLVVISRAATVLVLVIETMLDLLLAHPDYRRAWGVFNYRATTCAIKGCPGPPPRELQSSRASR
ncbi:MAG: hypothetical protein AAGA03_12440 [Planctomycetota bacterium]